MNGRWITPSSSKPFNDNQDVTLMREFLPTFSSLLSEHDLVIADKIFTPFRENNFITGHRKPRNGNLTQKQIQENQEIQVERGFF
jgi:hypothetical protein